MSSKTESTTKAAGISTLNHTKKLSASELGKQQSLLEKETKRYLFFSDEAVKMTQATPFNYKGWKLALSKMEKAKTKMEKHAANIHGHHITFVMDKLSADELAAVRFFKDSI